jgi:hypothetical protein
LKQSARILTTNISQEGIPKYDVCRRRSSTLVVIFEVRRDFEFDVEHYTMRQCKTQEQSCIELSGFDKMQNSLLMKLAGNAMSIPLAMIAILAAVKEMEHLSKDS